MQVSIYILNYNGCDLLKICLPSIIEAAGLSQYKPGIVIIDNNSSDNSEEFVNTLYPQVSFLKMPENRMLCSFNDVLANSACDIAILLNNDLKVDPLFIDPLIEIFIKHKDAFLAAARVYTFDGRQIEDAITIPVLKLGLFKAVSSESGYSVDSIKPSFTFQAGFGAFDRKKFVELNGYDKLYSPGIMEDADLCFRAWKRGYKCYHQPLSHIYHMGKATFKKNFGEKKLLALSHRNTYFFIWKNIQSKYFLLQTLLFIPPRIIYSLFAAKTEIIYGIIEFGKNFAKARAARKNESMKRSFYLINEKKVFSFFSHATSRLRIERLIGKRFDTLADTFPADIDEGDARLKAILNALGEIRNKKVLEIGCGKGRILRVLRKSGAQAYGIDISSRLLTEAVKTGSSLAQAEAYKLPFKDESFDCLIMLEVIEHLPDLEKALNQCRRVLKLNGRLVIVDRNIYSLNNRRFLIPNIIIKGYHELKNEWMYPRDFPYRERWFKAKEVAKKLTRYFADIKFEYVLSDGEKKKWWHGIFRYCPLARHFVLWKAERKTLSYNTKQTRVLKEFGFQGLKVREWVAKHPHIENIASTNSKLNNIFCLRIDADEYHPDTFAMHYPLFERYKNAITIFFCVNSFKDYPEIFKNCQKLGIDIQSHGYYHFTYPDYFRNRYNISKSKIFLKNAGLNTTGFAAPMGKWNWNLNKALADEGYAYSSDFSYDYLGIPSFPRQGNYTSPVMQIPIFPVAPELFFSNKETDAKETVNYYKQAIDTMKRCNLPSIIYAHTSIYSAKVIPILDEICQYALYDLKLSPKNMSQIYQLVCNNNSIQDNKIISLSIPEAGFLGEKIELGRFKKTKGMLREYLGI